MDFPPLKIAFLHPELGIGGAERLVVDAAVHLQAAGHRVTLFTTHHEQAQSFAETRDGLLAVRVHGDFLPRHIGQHLRAPCTIARLVPLAGALAWSGGQFDIIVCDLVSHIIPVLRLLSRARIVFYCHFPDLLLTPPRHFLYRLYRAPLDRWEELATGMADRVLVNSRFTASVFRQSFPHLHGLTPDVLYPGVDYESYTSIAAGSEEDGTFTFLSINRYEPKKNLGLAVEALALLRERLSADVFSRVRLIIAGGYDDRFLENRETLRELQRRAQRGGLGDHVTFKRSCSDEERRMLLARCRCVVYTPKDEHFGMVPLEAMAAARPVVAVNSGGPLETIRHEHTGLLCEPTPQAFAEAFAYFITNSEETKRMGQAGRRHVVQHFSRAAFGHRLETILHEVMRQPRGEQNRSGRHHGEEKG